MFYEKAVITEEVHENLPAPDYVPADLLKVWEKAKFYIYCLPEDAQVRGNAVASGDEDQDREIEDRIIDELESGNGWAWCTVRVKCTFRAAHRKLTGDDYLGCCSYDSADDFMSYEEGSYFPDMVNQAWNDMVADMADYLTGR